MPETITSDNYANLRDISGEFCAMLQSQTSGYLETIHHHYRPAAVFEPFLIGSHEDAPHADDAAASGQFKTYFAEAVASKPLSLHPSRHSQPVKLRAPQG